MLPPPPISPPSPYTTLFRSEVEDARHARRDQAVADGLRGSRRGGDDADGHRLGGHDLLQPVEGYDGQVRSEEHTSELQSRRDLVCRLLLENKKSEMGHRRER